jgi:hypothetical protein
LIAFIQYLFKTTNDETQRQTKRKISQKAYTARVCSINASYYYAPVWPEGAVKRYTMRSLGQTKPNFVTKPGGILLHEFGGFGRIVKSTVTHLGLTSERLK